MLRLSHLTDMMARTLRRRSEPLDGFALGTSVVLHAAFLGFLATVRFADPTYHQPREVEKIVRIHLNDVDEPKLSRLALKLEQKPSDGPAKAPVRIRRPRPKPNRNLKVTRKAPRYMAAKARGRGARPYKIVRVPVRKPKTTFRQLAEATKPKPPISTPPLPQDVDTTTNPEVRAPVPDMPKTTPEATEPQIEAPPAPKPRASDEPLRVEKPEPSETPRTFARADRPKPSAAPAPVDKPEAEAPRMASRTEVKTPDVLPAPTPRSEKEPPKPEAPVAMAREPEKRSPTIEGARPLDPTNPVAGSGTPGGSAQSTRVARRPSGSVPGEEGGKTGSPDRPVATGRRPDVIASAPSPGGPELPGSPGGPRGASEPGPGGKRIASLPADVAGGEPDAGGFQPSPKGIPGLPTGAGLASDTPARARGGGPPAAVALRDPGQGRGGDGSSARVFTGQGPGAPGSGRPTPGGDGGPAVGPSASAGGGEGSDGGGPGRTNGKAGLPTLLTGEGDPAPLGPGGPGEIAAPAPQATGEPRRGGTGTSPLPLPAPSTDVPSASGSGTGLITLPSGFNVLPGGPSGEGGGGPDAGSGGKSGLGSKPNPQGVYVNTTGEFDVPLAVTTSNYQFNAPALNRVVDEINGRTKLKVKLNGQAQPLKAGTVKPAPVMVFNGHKPFILTAAERQEVKNFVAKGGLIWADFTGGAFDASFQEEMRKVFGQAPTQLGAGHPIYRSYYLLDKVPAGDTGNSSLFEGIHQNGRLAVVVTRNRYFGAVAGAPHVSPDVQEGAIQAVVNIYIYGAQNYKATTE